MGKRLAEQAGRPALMRKLGVAAHIWIVEHNLGNHDCGCRAEAGGLLGRSPAWLQVSERFYIKIVRETEKEEHLKSHKYTHPTLQ